MPPKKRSAKKKTIKKKPYIKSHKTVESLDDEQELVHDNFTEDDDEHIIYCHDDLTKAQKIVLFDVFGKHNAVLHFNSFAAMLDQNKNTKQMIAEQAAENLVNILDTGTTIESSQEIQEANKQLSIELNRCFKGKNKKIRIAFWRYVKRVLVTSYLAAFDEANIKPLLTTHFLNYLRIKYIWKNPGTSNLDLNRLLGTYFGELALTYRDHGNPSYVNIIKNITSQIKHDRKKPKESELKNIILEIHDRISFKRVEIYHPRKLHPEICYKKEEESESIEAILERLGEATPKDKQQKTVTLPLEKAQKKEKTISPDIPNKTEAESEHTIETKKDEQDTLFANNDLEKETQEVITIKQQSETEVTNIISFSLHTRNNQILKIACFLHVAALADSLEEKSLQHVINVADRGKVVSAPKKGEKRDQGIEFFKKNTGTIYKYHSPVTNEQHHIAAEIKLSNWNGRVVGRINNSELHFDAFIPKPGWH